MADSSTQSPAPFQPLLEPEHAPAVSSPLNPTSRAQTKTPVPAIQREQREKKDSLKKRESNLNNNGPSTGNKRKASAIHNYPSPQRYNILPPSGRDWEAPKGEPMASNEPLPLLMPDGDAELFKPVDLAENKRGYRYTRAIADPTFPHKQFYRSTSPPPHQARLSFEDADKWMRFGSSPLITSNEKGWRMVRSNVCAREGTLYYEVKVHRGVPADGPTTDDNGPQPHVRFGWARREAPLDAPVGFDGYSYGVTDIRFEPMHRSRASKFFQPRKGKSKTAKAAVTAPAPIVLEPADQHVKEGDVIGIEIQLPSLSLHQKVISGVYNPAVDVGDGFDQPHPSLEPGAEIMDVIRDRIPVHYKNNGYFETLDHVSTKPMESYTDRTVNLSTLSTMQPGSINKDTIKALPNPNNEQVSLRTLPHSSINVYKNGKVIGTAFENLLAFLPPASIPLKNNVAKEEPREGFDDGMVGYFPAISCFWGGIAEVNFGDGPDGFWAPPAHLVNTKTGPPASDGQDANMADAGVDASGSKKGWNPGRQARGIGERYKEQVAEDVVWDIIDEVDFFIQDGGFDGTVGSGTSHAPTLKASRLRDEEM